jgi:AraC family transcriptional activator of pobA
MPTRAIPDFFLYGEAAREADLRFIHLETIAARSRPANWTIRVHAHRDLAHLLFVARGGGVMKAESQGLAFAAPALLIAAPGAVHGFDFEPETEGHILTLSEAYVGELAARQPEARDLFATCRALDLDEAAFAEHRFAEHLEAIGRELVWSAAGRGLALEGRLLCILAGALRAADVLDRPLTRSAAVDLVARFREMLEQRFQARTSVEDYAALLGVSQSRLRQSCVTAAGASPSSLVHARLMIEAKRQLLYTGRSVAEIGYDLGFDDPAYFTRFFTRRAGQSPRAFRAAARPSA